LDQFGHLPVPSEIFTRRGKKAYRRLRMTRVSRVEQKRINGLAGETLAITKGNEGTKVVSQSDRSIESPQQMGVPPTSTTVPMEDASICSKKK
jgi:hypothetical protein